MSWKQIMTVGGIAVTGFLYLIYSKQESILYLNETIPPKRTSDNPSPYANPKQSGLDYDNIWITTKDNIKLHAWWIPFKTISKTSPTLIFYHANAGNMGFRLPNIVALNARLSVNIFIISYRGYGESEGVPSEEGIMIDALAGFDYLYNNLSSSIDKSRIYLFGRSLGGAVAIYTTLKNDNKINGLIIENTFSSISEMVGKVFPFLDFEFIKKFMLKIHWRSIDRIPNIQTNLLFLACENDEIVPHQQMIKLYKNAKNCNSKSMYVIPGGTHNDGWMRGGDEYWNRLHNFIYNSHNPNLIIHNDKNDDQCDQNDITHDNKL